MKRQRILTACLLAALFVVGPRRATADILVYSNDFTGGAGAEWSDPTTVVSNGERFLGANQSGNLALGFGAGTDTLTLAGLAAHDTVTVNFDLYIIQSMDGNGPNGGGPDVWQLAENANSLEQTTFANFTGGNTQSYSAATPDGLGFSNAPRSGEFDAGHLGFGTGDFGDATYRFSFTFASSDSTLALAFTSLQNQAPGDEGWGLDNVSVSIHPTAVPEPSSLVLVGLGSLGLVRGYRARKARRA